MQARALCGVCLLPGFLRRVEGHRDGVVVAEEAHPLDGQQLPALHLSQHQEPALVFVLGEAGGLRLTVLLPLEAHPTEQRVETRTRCQHSYKRTPQ